MDEPPWSGFGDTGRQVVVGPSGVTWTSPLADDKPHPQARLQLDPATWHLSITDSGVPLWTST